MRLLFAESLQYAVMLTTATALVVRRSAIRSLVGPRLLSASSQVSHFECFELHGNDFYPPNDKTIFYAFLVRSRDSYSAVDQSQPQLAIYGLQYRNLVCCFID